MIFKGSFQPKPFCDSTCSQSSPFLPAPPHLHLPCSSFSRFPASLTRHASLLPTQPQPPHQPALTFPHPSLPEPTPGPPSSFCSSCFLHTAHELQRGQGRAEDTSPAPITGKIYPALPLQPSLTVSLAVLQGRWGKGWRTSSCAPKTHTWSLINTGAIIHYSTRSGIIICYSGSSHLCCKVSFLKDLQPGKWDRAVVWWEKGTLTCPVLQNSAWPLKKPKRR